MSDTVADRLPMAQVRAGRDPAEAAAMTASAFKRSNMSLLGRGRARRGETGVETLHATAYTVHTEGTVSWDATTIVVATVTADGLTGTGWTYGAPAPTASAELNHPHPLEKTGTPP